MRSLIGAILLATVLSVACTDERSARRALEASGFTKITITGYEHWLCGKDSTCTGFTATGPTGIKISGAVGCGVFGKGCTVRIR